MDKQSQKNIESDLEQLKNGQWYIIVDIAISIQNMARLRENKYEFEEKIKQRVFFRHHWGQLKFILIIQLFKLFNNNSKEEFSFYTLQIKLSELYNICESNSGYVEFSRGQIQKNELKDLLHFLKTELKKNTVTIQKIKTARNKVFAHLESGVSVEYIAFDELSDLTQLSKELYNRINLLLFNTESLFWVDDWSIEYILFNMNAMQIKDNEEAEAKKRMLISKKSI